MRSVNADAIEFASALPSALQISPKTEETPEIKDVSKQDFEVKGDKVFVSLQTMSGDPVKFVIGLDKFLLGITAAVAVMNLHLPQFLDMIGGP